MRKKRFASCLIILLIAFILNFNIITAAEETTSTTTSAPVEKEVVDVGILLGFEAGEIFGSGISTTSLGDCNQRISFAEDDANLKLGDNSFSNIGPLYEAVDGGEPVKQNSYIDIDCSGNILKADFKTNDKGGIYGLNGIGIICEPNSRVKYDFEKGKLEMENSKIGSLEDIILFSDSSNLEITGKNIEFTQHWEKSTGKKEYSKNKLDSGTLEYNPIEQGFFLNTKKMPSSGSTINGITISPNGKDNVKLVFQDQPNKEKNFIWFHKNTFIISQDKENSNVILTTFKEGNPYLKIEKDDYVTFTTNPNSKIIITNREKEGLIPRVSGFSYDEGKSALALFDSKKETPFYTIENGEMLVKGYKVNGEYGVFLDKKNIELEGTTSTPMEVRATGLDKNGAYIDRKRIVMDNFNKLVVTPDLNSPVESVRLNYNYPSIKSIEKIIGYEVKFSDSISEQAKNIFLSNIQKEVNKITPEMKESIKLVQISNKKIREPYSNRELLPPAYCAGQELVFNEEQDIIEYAFVHEAAHARNLVLNNEDRKESDEMIKELTEATETVRETIIYGKIQNKLNNEEIVKYERRMSDLKIAIDNYKKELSEDDFSLKWVEVNKKSDVQYYINPKYGDHNGRFYAHSGYLSDYARTNYLEDVAETTKFVVNSPKEIKGLLLESNPYHEVYRGKLDLLYEYRFITREQYQNALKIGMSQ